MGISIACQTSLGNGLNVYSVVFCEAENQRSEEYVYPSVSALLRRLRRDKETEQNQLTEMES